MPNPNPFAQAFAGTVNSAATGKGGVPGASSAPRVGPPKATGPKTPKNAAAAVAKSQRKKMGY